MILMMKFTPDFKEVDFAKFVAGPFDLNKHFESMMEEAQLKQKDLVVQFSLCEPALSDDDLEDDHSTIPDPNDPENTEEVPF